MIRLFYWLQDLWRGNLLGGLRSPEWSKVRKEFIAENPLCAVCEKKGSLLKPNEAHHCQPFHLNPELELLKSNLIILCRPHHLLFGHLNNFKSFNSNVREDAKIWKQKIQQRP